MHEKQLFKVTGTSGDGPWEIYVFALSAGEALNKATIVKTYLMYTTLTVEHIEYVQ